MGQNLSDASDKTYNGQLKVQVVKGECFCPSCTRQIGMVVIGRNMDAGTIVLVKRTPFRCHSCRAYLIWTPLRA